MIKTQRLTLFRHSIVPILCGQWVGCNFQASGPLSLLNYNVLSFIILIKNDVRNLELQIASLEQRKAYENVLRLVEEEKVYSNGISSFKVSDFPLSAYKNFIFVLCCWQFLNNMRGVLINSIIEVNPIACKYEEMLPPLVHGL